MAPQFTRKKWALSHLILLLLLSLSLHQFFIINGHQASISFLDVGQGDAILIQTEEHKNILIDTGPDGKVIEELSKELSFFNQTIDLFILTHPDLDHYGGALDVLLKYPVKSVMITGIASESQLYLAFLKELKRQSIPIIYPQSAQDWQIGKGLFMDILYPFENQSLLGQKVGNKNDTSISLLLRNRDGEGLVMLTGDGEKSLERDLLLSSQDLGANILKLGHHGSKTSSTANFIAAVEPQVAIVSAGKNNKFGHPHKEVLHNVGGLELRYTWNQPVMYMLGSEGYSTVLK